MNNNNNNNKPNTNLNLGFSIESLNISLTKGLENIKGAISNVKNNTKKDTK